MTNKNSLSAPVNGVSEKRDLYQEVTNTIIAQLDKGVALWHKPWIGDDFNPFLIPKNVTSKKGYNGVNILLLWGATLSKDLKSHDWSTFKQWSEKGERIKKGEKGTTIVFYDRFTVERDGEEKQIPFLKCSTVFNRCQLESYVPASTQIEELPNQAKALENVERFVEKTKAKVTIAGTSAMYVPSKDEIFMPPAESFIETEELSATGAYYATLLHELGHWTGHKDRTGREFGDRFGSKTYAFEELIAELTAAFLCGELNVTNCTSETHASYIANWLQIMKDDKKAIFTAASAASKAVDYLKTLQTISL
jgi:antirestriction protein ArdC